MSTKAPAVNGSAVASQGKEALRLKKVLEDAEDDLLHAELPGIAGKVFNPVRDEILSPALSAIGHVIPELSAKLPLTSLTDQVGAFTLGTTIGVVKFWYSILPHKDVDEEARQIEEREVLHSREVVKCKYEIEKLPRKEGGGVVSTVIAIIPHPNEIASAAKAVWGFSANMLIDIATAPWTGKLGEWVDEFKSFVGYLLYTGIDEELAGVFFNPRVESNALIVGHTQAKMNYICSVKNRRARTSLNHYPLKPNKFKPMLQEASRYIKYSTAAYGVSMIESADKLTVFPGKEKTVGIVGHIAKQLNDVAAMFASGTEKARKRKIARYVNIKEEDIVFITPSGADQQLLGHFVAVDHKAQAVVLAIRGTYSLSGLLTDISAYSKRFCGGLAHSGIADQAINLWVDPKTHKATRTQKAIVKALRENKGYELVLTGHSLGAGAACLLNIKIHYDNSPGELVRGVPGVQVQCFGFASPPVYAQLPTNERKPDIDDAMSCTKCYIHEDDCVPFLSADSVRRLADTLKLVDSETSKLNILDRRLTARNLKETSDSIKMVVEDGSSDLPVKHDAPRLVIPSSYVLWLRHIKDDANHNNRPIFDAMFCSPHDISNLSILLSRNMISDHMSPKYERAIYSTLEQEIKGGKGYMLIGSS